MLIIIIGIHILSYAMFGKVFIIAILISDIVMFDSGKICIVIKES